MTVNKVRARSSSSGAGMESRAIKPLGRGVDAELKAPPSKAHTLRALFLAALAEGESVLENPLCGNDQLIAISALQKFGAVIEKRDAEAIVAGTGGDLKAPKKVFAGNSGVSLRFLCAVAALAGRGGEKIVLDGDERMRQRPAGGLLSGLGQLGAKARSLRNNGCPPVEVIGKSMAGGFASISAAESSQFASALLVSLPLAPRDSELKLVGEIRSRPYIGMTLECIKAFGGRVQESGENAFQIPAGQCYEGTRFKIEGDYSSAAFLFQAAAITGGRVKVRGLRRDSLQGDKRFLELLGKMGCKVRQLENKAEVTGVDGLMPISADLGDCPDIVMPLAVACAFADGKSVISNIGHLRLKESDRLAALESGLAAMGVKARAAGGSLEITGDASKLKGALIESFGDHRIAMAFAVAGLRVPGIRISNPGCVSKSYPEFFTDLSRL